MFQIVDNLIRTKRHEVQHKKAGFMFFCVLISLVSIIAWLFQNVCIMKQEGD